MGNLSNIFEGKVPGLNGPINIDGGFNDELPEFNNNSLNAPSYEFDKNFFNHDKASSFFNKKTGDVMSKMSFDNIMPKMDTNMFNTKLKGFDNKFNSLMSRFNNKLPNISSKDFNNKFNSLMGKFNSPNIKNNSKDFNNKFNSLKGGFNMPNVNTKINNMLGMEQKNKPKKIDNKFNNMMGSFNMPNMNNKINNMMGNNSKQFDNKYKDFFNVKPENVARNRIKNQNRLPLWGDIDGDKVPNILDCRPLDKTRQGFIHKTINLVKGKGFVDNEDPANQNFEQQFSERNMEIYNQDNTDNNIDNEDESLDVIYPDSNNIKPQELSISTMSENNELKNIEETQSPLQKLNNFMGTGLKNIGSVTSSFLQEKNKKNEAYKNLIQNARYKAIYDSQRELEDKKQENKKNTLSEQYRKEKDKTLSTLGKVQKSLQKIDKWDTNMRKGISQTQAGLRGGAQSLSLGAGAVSPMALKESTMKVDYLLGTRGLGLGGGALQLVQPPSNKSFPLTVMETIGQQQTEFQEVGKEQNTTEPKEPVSGLRIVRKEGPSVEEQIAMRRALMARQQALQQQSYSQPQQQSYSQPQQQNGVQTIEGVEYNRLPDGRWKNMKTGKVVTYPRGRYEKYNQQYYQRYQQQY